MDQGQFGKYVTDQGNYSGNKGVDSWICPECETINTGVRCAICGYQKDISIGSTNKRRRLFAIGCFVFVVGICFFISQSNRIPELENRLPESDIMEETVAQREQQKIQQDETIPRETTILGNPTEMEISPCLVTSWGGVFVDEFGKMWTWDQSDKILVYAQEENVVSLTIDTQDSIVYYLYEDGNLGCFVYNRNLKKATLHKKIPLEYAAKAIECGESGLYILDNNGLIHWKNPVNGYSTDECYSRLPIVNAFQYDGFSCFYARTNSGDFICWKEEDFILGSTSLYSFLESPDDTQKMWIFRCTGYENLIYVYMDKENTVSLHDENNNILYKVENCEAVFTNETSAVFLAKDGIYAYGSFVSGVPLNESTEFFDTVTNPTDYSGESENPYYWNYTYFKGKESTDIDYIALGDWHMAVKYKDGSIRYWGQECNDSYLHYTQ